MKTHAAVASALVGIAPLFLPDNALAREPVEYVRVCDAFGTGFFYIPGTDTAISIGGQARSNGVFGDPDYQEEFEDDDGFFYIPGTDTCLRIGGYVSHSWIDNRSELGGGTVRFGFGGPELKNYSFDEVMSRWGGGVSLEYGLGGSTSYLGLPVSGYQFLFGDFQGAIGTAEASGRQEVGVDGVTLVGYTYLFEDMGSGSTGVSASTPGFGIEGRGEIENGWALGWIGLGQSVPLTAESGTGTGTAIVLKVGPYAESFGYEADGRVDITFNNQPFNGFFQEFDFSSHDTFLGVKGHIDYVWQPHERWQVSVGGSVFTGYHYGEGSIEQVNGTGGGSTLVQSHSYSDSSWFVGGGLSASIQWRPLDNLSISSGVEYSYLPDVTSYRAPANPSGQPGAWESEGVSRLFVNIFRVSGAF